MLPMKYVISVFLIFLTALHLTTQDCSKTNCSQVSPTPNPLLTKVSITVPDVTFECKPGGKHKAIFTCPSDEYHLNQSSESICDESQHQWKPPLSATCVANNVTAKSNNKWVYIGGGIGGGVMAAVIVIVALVCYKRKLRAKKEEEEAIAMRKFGNMTLGPNGERISSIPNISYPYDLSIHKVWTCKRTRKKFLHAESLSSLLGKVGPAFGYSGAVKLVLEEDGTEIDNDVTLQACAGKVLLLLGENETWKPAYELAEETHRLTFDACSFDRKTRKLILADSMKDLKFQGSSTFGYPVQTICLEEDGTTVEDDTTLCSCSTQTLMLMGSDHIWRPFVGELVKIPSQIDINSETRIYASVGHQSDMYKVWTEDRRVKKVVFADSLVDLHIKASKALGLKTPVMICLLDKLEEITDDEVLHENAGKIMIVREKMKETPFNGNLQRNEYAHRTNFNSTENIYQSWPRHHNEFGPTTYQAGYSPMQTGSNLQKHSHPYNTSPSDRGFPIRHHHNKNGVPNASNSWHIHSEYNPYHASVNGRQTDVLF